MRQQKTCDMKRELPKWAKIIKRVNDTSIYNMNIFDNIMSWNQHNLDVPAFDYYGKQITYRELPEQISEYVRGFIASGINTDSVVTLCMPVSIENMMSLLALGVIGSISNSVNFLFLKSNLKKYTKEKESDTIIILDAYLPFIVDYLEECEIKNVIITSLKDYLPENRKHIFDDVSSLSPKLQEVFSGSNQSECMAKIRKSESVRFLRLPDILEIGRNMPRIPISGPVDIERDISYSYTSGTTGEPKCIVYKEVSANAFVEMHAGLDTKDYIGERVFQTIPLTHATGERVSGYLQMAKGKTLVPHPIYNKDSFGEDLMASKCNWVVAAPSFYLAGVAKGLIASDAFSNLTRPTSGGEPVTRSCVKQIDRWLRMNGCNVRFAIDGGAAEDGSGTMFTYFMDERTKTNETGYPLEPAVKAKIVDSNGNCTAQGERGILHISSAAAADRYLNDTEATAARWYYDKAGTRWGITGDIAIQNVDGSYNILGRASDSFVNSKGEVVYLFDIEYSLSADDPVVEWEISAHQVKDGHVVVGQVILKKDCKMSKGDIVELLCSKYHLDAIKFYSAFETSDTTGKRDYQKLNMDKEDYYAPRNKDSLFKCSFYENTVPVKAVVPKGLV